MGMCTGSKSELKEAVVKLEDKNNQCKRQLDSYKTQPERSRAAMEAMVSMKTEAEQSTCSAAEKLYYAREHAQL